MKAVLETLDSLDEALHAEYEERDGQFFLKVDGDIPGLVPADGIDELKRSVAEFRDNNINLERRLREEKGKGSAFDGIDPETYRSMEAELADLKKKTPKRESELVAVTAQLEKLSGKFDELTASAKADREALSRTRLTDALQAAATKAGVSAKAMTDALSRAAGVFSIDKDGAFAARNGEGQIYSEENPGKPLGMAEFFGSLRTEASHLFEESKGAGTETSTGEKRPGVPNAENMTPQQLGDQETVKKFLKVANQ